MTATILLVRHAAHEQLGQVLSGRLPGLPLSAEGASQAGRLGIRLGGEAIDLLHSSPVQRALETARAVAAAGGGMTVEPVPALNELDFGDWTGQAFAELADDPRWQRWNAARASAAAPNGESMAQVQDRAWRHVERTALAFGGRTIAMVSHGDVIRAIAARVLALSLDDIHRFEINPASVSRVSVGSWGAKLLSLNEEYHA